MTLDTMIRWLEEGQAGLRKQDIGPDQYYREITLYNRGEAEITKFCNVLRVRVANNDWAKAGALLFLERNGWITIGSKGHHLTFGDILSFNVIDHGYYLEWLFELSYWNENQAGVEVAKAA